MVDYIGIELVGRIGAARFMEGDLIPGLEAPKDLFGGLVSTALPQRKLA